MGQTNMPVQKAFNIPGGALMQVYDPQTTAWSKYTAVSDVRFRPDTDKIMQYGHLEGERVTTQTRTIARRGSLSFTLKERLQPAVMQLVFGDPAVAQTKTAAAIASEKYQTPLYDTDVTYVPNPYAHAAAQTITAPTITSATPAADCNGTGWTPGAYYMFLVPVWGDPTGVVGSGATDYSAALDVSFYAGTPSASTTFTITNANDTVAVVIPAYTADSPLDNPDYWMVFVNTSDTITGSTIAYIDGTATPGDSYKALGTSLTLNGPGTATYAASVGMAVESISTYETTPTYTKYVSGTDFTYDSANGNVKRISGGGISDGEEVRITYWAFWPDKVNTQGGVRTSSTVTYKVRILHMEGEVDKTSTDPTIGEGEEWIFYRVDFSGPSTEVSYTEEDFDAGMPVEVETEFDIAQNKIFDHYTHSRKLANWAQKYQ